MSHGPPTLGSIASGEGAVDHFVYLDETGTLDFDDIAGERYFGVGSATWTGHHGEAIWQGHLLRLNLEAAGIRLPKGLHAKNDSAATRSQVFELIATQRPRLDATLLLKSNAQPQVRRAGKVRLYKLALWMHLKHVIPTISARGDSIFVIAGHLQTTGHREAIRSAIDDVADQLENDRRVVACIWEAPSSWGIQVADYALWRIQREDAGRALPRSAELIDPCIASRFYPWQKA